MKELTAKFSRVRAELGIDDINPGDICRLSCPEEGNEYILIAVANATGPRCYKCTIQRDLGIRTCYTGCSRRGFYFRRIDNMLEEL